MNGYTLLRIAIKDRAWKTFEKYRLQAILVSLIYTVCLALCLLCTAQIVRGAAQSDIYSAIGAGALFGIFSLVITAPMFAGIFELFDDFLKGKKQKLSLVFSWYTDADKFSRAIRLCLIFTGACIAALFIVAVCMGICFMLVSWVFSDLKFWNFDIFAAFVALAVGAAVAFLLLTWLNALITSFFAISHSLNVPVFRCFCDVFAKTVRYSLKFFTLTASFALFYIACILTAGLLIPVVMPYILMSYILFYRSCVTLDGKDPKIPEYMQRINQEREKKLIDKKIGKKGRKRTNESAGV